MDLLGDLGAEDQLTSARAENAVLQKRVKELSKRVQVLTVENESLKAEVETYRKEAALPNFSNLALGKSETVDSSSMMDVEGSDNAEAFVRSGNGVFAVNNEVTLSNLHLASNPLCCALSSDDTILATGGADSHISLCAWGAAWGTTNDASAAAKVVQSAYRLRCDAPVICTAFSPALRGVLAAGSMDGSLQLVQYEHTAGRGLQARLNTISADLKHRKYVRAVVWAEKEPMLATASADGSVHVYRVERSDGVMMDLSSSELKLDKVQSLHLPGPVESLCFADNYLICYARGTPYLSYFDLAKDFQQRKVNLNTNVSDSAGRATGGFDEHVSFAIMDLKACNNNKYLAAATDNSRNMILDLQSGKQIRNLYGHTNDGFSHPKLAWSRSGQYLYGNTQDESTVCVWDIASSQIVTRLQSHTSQIRDMYSSATTDTLVTTAFDKQTKFYFAAQEAS